MIRSGFTLAEVIVALAIVLIMAAVAVPQLAGYLDQKRVEETAVQLALVRDALYTPGGGSVAFYQTVGSNAGELSQLADPLTTAHDDSCGSNFTNGQRNRWRNQGPYVNFLIDPLDGMATPVGQARNQLTRIPANGGGAAGRLRITIDAVSQTDAQELDVFVDGVAGAASGTVQWTGLPDGTATVFYDVMINNVC